MKLPRFSSIVAAALLAAPASGKEKPFEKVAAEVHRRTGQEVRWEQDLAAREETRGRVRTLLKRPLTLTTAVQIALLNNRGLQASFEELGLSYAELRAARQVANPELDLLVKFPDRPPSAAMLEWQIAQNFMSLLMLPLRTKVAREQFAAAQSRAADAVIRLVGETKAAWYELVATEQLTDRYRATLEAQRASLELMQGLHAAGNVNDLALTREQAQYSQLRLEAATAESAARAAREKLNRLMSVWGAETDWKLATRTLPAVPKSELTLRGLETVAVANRLDLAAARAELESAVHAAGLEKTFRFIGALDFGLAGERDPDGTKLTGPSLRLELPVFNQGQARLARTEGQLRMAAAKFEQLAIELRSEVRELHDRLLTRQKAARFYDDEIVPTQRRLTALTLLQYNAMLTGAFEAFTARREDLAAERSQIEATRDYWITRAELERTVGGDLSAGPHHPTNRK